LLHTHTSCKNALVRYLPVSSAQPNSPQNGRNRYINKPAFFGNRGLNHSSVPLHAQSAAPLSCRPSLHKCKIAPSSKDRTEDRPVKISEKPAAPARVAYFPYSTAQSYSR